MDMPMNGNAERLVKWIDIGFDVQVDLDSVEEEVGRSQ
jgi:hypothetical protein